MTIHHSPDTTDTTHGDNAEGGWEQPAGFETACVDLVCSARHTVTAQYLAGLLAHGQLRTTGTQPSVVRPDKTKPSVVRPDKLPADLFPGEDPDLVQRVWNRSAAVHFAAGMAFARPRRTREQMEADRATLAGVAFTAMGGLIDRSLATPMLRHPADEESDGWGHDA